MSFPRRRESKLRGLRCVCGTWIPACAGRTFGQLYAGIFGNSLSSVTG
jgi:hypothetical protein